MSTDDTSGVNLEKKNFLFGGTLSMNRSFTSKFSYSSMYSFASHDQVFRIKYFRFNYAIQELRKLLLYTFVGGLGNYTPDQFVEVYGTHLLCDISIGERLNLIYRSLIYTESSSTMKQVVVKSGFMEHLLKF